MITLIIIVQKPQDIKYKAISQYNKWNKYTNKCNINYLILSFIENQVIQT